MQELGGELLLVVSAGAAPRRMAGLLQARAGVAGNVGQTIRVCGQNLIGA